MLLSGKALQNVAKQQKNALVKAKQILVAIDTFAFLWTK